jgi:hypothetical protein
MAAMLSALRVDRPLPPNPPQVSFLKFLVLISVRDWVHPRAIVRPEELGKSEEKKKSTSSGRDPATFRLLKHNLSLVGVHEFS